MNAHPLDPLGRMVREVRLIWAHLQPDPKASWLRSWEELSPPEREVDRMIGDALWTPAFVAGQASRNGVEQDLREALVLLREWVDGTLSRETYGERATRTRNFLVKATPTFTCPVCGAISFNPTDIREGYCGRCHDWTEARHWVPSGPSPI